MYSTKVSGAVHKLAEETDIGGGSSVLVSSPKSFFGQWFDPQNIVGRYRYYRITLEFQSSRIEKSIDTFNSEGVVHNVSFVTYNESDKKNRIICLSFGFQGRYCVCKSARMKLDDSGWTDLEQSSIYMVKLIGSNYPILKTDNPSFLFSLGMTVKTYPRKREGMKRMKVFDFVDAYNALLGAIIAFLTMIFGEHWFLFAFFLILNIIDWLTGWMKSRMAGKENSVKGWQGVLKKIGYWLMIAFGFGIAACLIEVGATIGVDLQITTVLGWFVLASLIVNEARSIIENFVEAGFNVPMILQNGLEVADKLINKEESHDQGKQE